MTEGLDYQGVGATGFEPVTLPSEKTGCSEPASVSACYSSSLLIQALFDKQHFCPDNFRSILLSNL